mmetsp:Transcript_47592/g.78980  ORF Transcript_47592/g.78980 Transcript_47592/m.78980 type:complete len:289 (+) Transcript_47592:671-1537(+)
MHFQGATRANRRLMLGRILFKILVGVGQYFEFLHRVRHEYFGRQLLQQIHERGDVRHINVDEPVWIRHHRFLHRLHHVPRAHVDAPMTQIHVDGESSTQTKRVKLIFCDIKLQRADPQHTRLGDDIDAKRFVVKLSVDEPDGSSLVVEANAEDASVEELFQLRRVDVLANQTVVVAVLNPSLVATVQVGIGRRQRTKIARHDIHHPHLVAQLGRHLLGLDPLAQRQYALLLLRAQIHRVEPLIEVVDGNHFRHIRCLRRWQNLLLRLVTTVDRCCRHWWCWQWLQWWW